MITYAPIAHTVTLASDHWPMPLNTITSNNSAPIL